MSDETYLGDGVYLSYDGYQLWLRVTREASTARIALEPAVFAALLAYVSELQRKNQQAPA